jgi:glycerol-1-phosphate dehydrogenase [NAD(P)+]
LPIVNSRRPIPRPFLEPIFAFFARPIECSDTYATHASLEHAMTDAALARPDWNERIREIVAGTWVDPETGAGFRVPYKSIVIADDLSGREAELVAPLGLGRRIAVVSDAATHGVLGRRVEAALAGIAEVRSVVMERPKADEATIAAVAERTRDADGVVAVGSGTINDVCKFVTFSDGRPYAVFATAPSMNGYTSTTASVTSHTGLKTSLRAHAPLGVFVDLAVNAAAPTYLIAAGLGDSLCRSTAQVDWWLSHRLFDTEYTSLPFRLQVPDETLMLEHAPGLATSDPAAVAYLHRVLALVGLGVSFVGTTHHGSMGEHQISHYIDCFAGERHSGTRHGQQVGVASLTMARLQHRLFAFEEPPRVEPTRIDEADMVRRCGSENAQQCLVEWRKKALSAETAAALNEKLARVWPELRRECEAFMLPVETMESALHRAGGPISAAELRLDPDFYREAVLHAREMRNRYSVLDLLADADMLEDAVAYER